MEVNREIFRSYDIRGIVEKDLDASFARNLGKAFGSFVQESGEKNIIVGHDCRESSDKLNDALIDGLISAGIDVVDIGLSTTPMVYYARKKLKIGPAIQITASHNPSEYNGFKMCTNLDDESIYGEKIQELRAYMEKGEFKCGNGSIKKQSIKEMYIEELSEKIKLGNRKLKVVVDCANATSSIVTVELFEKLGVEVVPLYCNIDPKFPHHHPDPSIEKNMMDLSNKVKEVKADVGFGFDGDGDRVGAVDEKGNMIFGDTYMLIMWREIIKNHPNSKALVEVKCSQKLWDELIRLGANPEFIRTGNPYIKAAMRENDIPFSGEMSGHIFYRDEYYGFDDALYAAARFTRMLSNTNKNVSELLENTADYIATPELSRDMDDSVKFIFIDKAVNYFKNKGFQVVDVDGARVIFDCGWGLIRASNTSPKITLRYEANSKENLDKIQREFDEMFNAIK